MSDEQVRVAALDAEQSFCITAPAGSGKTELLTQRVLALIPRVKRPEQILAITFTRKAAAEMRERIVRALEDAQHQVPIEAEHARRTRELAIAALNHAREQQWSTAADAFNIRTIDGLCGYLTRRMPVLSGTGGSLDTVDNAEPYYEEAIAELMTSVGADNATGAALEALLINFDNNWTALRDVLISLLHRRGDWANVLGHHYDQQRAEHVLLAAVADLVDGVVQDVARQLKPWQTALEPLLQSAALRLVTASAAGALKTGAPLAPRVPLCFEPNHLALEDWRWVAEMLLVKDRKYPSLRKRLDKNCGFPPESKAEKTALMDLLEAMGADRVLLHLLDELRRLPLVTPNDQSWQLVLHLSHLLPVLAAHLLLVFQRHGQVDHTHVALAAEEALGYDDAPTDLALRLDYQLEHILVDEFQDTSAPQFRLLEKLTRGWAEHNASGAQPRTLFIVGDGMQSIYRFRDANVGLFLQARQQGIGGVLLRSAALTRNFRSQAGIVDWVNNAFARLLPEHDDVARGLVRHAPAEAIHSALAGQAVETHFFQAEAEGAEGDFIAGQIQALRATEPFASIAILGRARRHLQTIIEALRRQEIPFLGHDLEPLSQSPAVVDLLSLCRWLANPADSVAAVALMRCPSVGLPISAIQAFLADGSSPFALLERLTIANTEPATVALSVDSKERALHLAAALTWGWSRRDRLSLPVWIEQVWLRLGGHLTLNAAQFGDAQRFFDLLRKAERDGRGLDIAWLQREAGLLYARHTAQDHAVELLTLHKSKGLQFDYVFVVGLAATTRSNGKSLLQWHFHQSRLAGAGSRGLLIAANDQSDSNTATLFNYLTWLNKAGEEAELRRLLYVAITRAKRRVWLTAELATDDAGDRLKPPSTGSLLGILYDQVAEHATSHIAPLKHHAQTAGASALPLKRLRHVPNTYPRQLDLNQSSALIDTRKAASGLVDSHPYARAVGVALHRGLELLAGAPELPTTCPAWLHPVLGVSLRAQGITAGRLLEALAVVVSMIDNTLADERGRWLLAAHLDAASELSIVQKNGSDGARELIIDRTFTDSVTGVRWIVDYKTSSLGPGLSLDDFLVEQSDRYGAQLALYREAMVQLMPGITDVRCALYFPAIPAWHCLTVIE